MEALHAHHASVSSALRGRTNATAPDCAPCLAPNAASPYAERSYASNCAADRGYGAENCGERSFGAERGFEEPSSGGACGSQTSAAPNQAALARARRAASCTFNTADAPSPQLYGAPPPPPPPERASLSNISLLDDDAPADGSAV
jgi:hypothetical protein